MVVLGILGGANHFALILAFRAAPASVISPLEYSRLIWATSFGYVLFGDLPDLWAVAGGALIVVSGLYIYSRDSRIPR
jgi:drug/metabolite transporter (DMT)-like permease